VSLWVLSVSLLLSPPDISAAAGDSTVLAKVNGAPITRKDAEEEVGRIIPRTLFHRNVSPEKIETFIKEAVEKLIDVELQVQEAKAQGIKVEKKEIKSRLNEIKEKFSSDKAFKEALERNNMTLKTLEAKIRRAALFQKIVRKEVDDRIKITDEEVRAHYDGNPQRYMQMEMVRIRHIMVRFDKDDEGQGAIGEGQKENTKKTRTKEEAKARAEELLTKIKDGGDFAAVAYENSDDPYRVKGGDMGYVHKGRIIPELEEAAFAAKTGDVIGPVETADGIYVLKIEDHKAEKQFELDEVKDRIKDELFRERREDRIKEWLTALRSKAKIEYVEE